jgi:hypothetical protein
VLTTGPVSRGSESTWDGYSDVEFGPFDVPARVTHLQKRETFDQAEQTVEGFLPFLSPIVYFADLVFMR